MVEFIWDVFWSTMYNRCITMYNNALLEAIEVLQRQLQGFINLIFYYYILFYNIIKNPSKYDSKTIMIGSVTDAYNQYEEKYGRTRDFLKETFDDSYFKYI